MTPTLANLRARHTRMGQLLDEIELLERPWSDSPTSWLSRIFAVNRGLHAKVLERLHGPATLSDIIPAMIHDREQALADLGLRIKNAGKGNVIEANEFSDTWEAKNGFFNVKP
jgi:hypothetical protein